MTDSNTTIPFMETEQIVALLIAEHYRHCPRTCFA